MLYINYIKYITNLSDYSRVSCASSSMLCFHTVFTDSQVYCSSDEYCMYVCMYMCVIVCTDLKSLFTLSAFHIIVQY